MDNQRQYFTITIDILCEKISPKKIFLTPQSNNKIDGEHVDFEVWKLQEYEYAPICLFRCVPQCDRVNWINKSVLKRKELEGTRSDDKS